MKQRYISWIAGGYNMLVKNPGMRKIGWNFDGGNIIIRRFRNRIIVSILTDDTVRRK